MELFRRNIVSIDRDDTRESDETRIAVSISSETPYRRRKYLGFPVVWEVLGHSEDEIDLRFFRQGGALLLEHDKKLQIGTIEDVYLDGSVLRGYLRFSRSNMGQEIENDVRDGIRKYLSVGHSVDDFEIIGEVEGVPVLRVTKWTPVECSIVAAPADLTVGVGKSIEITERDMTRKEKLEKALRELEGEELEKALQEIVAEIDDEERADDEEGGRADDEEEERADEEEEERADEEEEPPAGERAAGITIQKRSVEMDSERMKRLASLAHEYGRSADLPDWIEAERSVESVLEEILDKSSNAHQSVQGAMSDKEQKEISVIRALDGLMSGGNSLLNEMGVDAARSSGVQVVDKDSLYIPLNVPVVPVSVRNLQSGSGPGANLVGIKYLSVVEALRETTLIGTLGIQQIDGQGALLEFPRIAGVEAQFVGEDDEITPTEPGAAKVQLRPKMLVADVGMTMMLGDGLDGTYNSEDIVRRDIFGAIMEGAEGAVASADGTGSSPFGLINNPSIPHIAAIGTTDPISYSQFVEMAKVVAKNKGPKTNLHYVVSPDLYADGLTTSRFGEGTALPIIPDTSVVNGKPVHESNFVSGYQALFGNFTNVLFATWGALQINVNRTRQSNRRRTILEGTLLMDTDVRQPDALVRHLGLRATE